MYSACQKFFAFLICLFQALICLFSGVYGDYEQIGVVNCILIVLQLCGAGILTILLDDLLQKGYGLGNGVSLFVASNIFANILWSCASFQSVKAPSGDLEYEGILIFLIHSIIRWRGFYDCLFRTYAPNLINLISTLIIGLIVNFTQNHRVELQLQSQRVREGKGVYPIRLLYTSNIPMMMQCAILQALYFMSQMLQLNLGKRSFIVSMVGTWKEATAFEPMTATGGLAYYLSPANSPLEVVRLIAYIFFTVAICSDFALFWVKLSGKSGKDICRQL